jgi:hypothetical protein
MENKDNNREQEKREQAPGSKGNDSTPIYLTGDSTLQTPEEDEHDKSIDARRNDTFEPSNDDLHETKADRLAGTDRAGTAERKE